MKKQTFNLFLIFSLFCSLNTKGQSMENFKPFTPPVSYEEADKRASALVAKMSIDEKILLIGGHDMFYTQGFEKYGIPQFYFSDATQGVHIRRDLPNHIEKSTAFPCPMALTATWNPTLANKMAAAIGEECRASDIAVLLGPGMNIYRISQNGRNFEYFGEDPFLAARMVEQYVTGMQSTGTMATLKHFLCNNTDYHRRTSNSIVDERTLNEIYLPAFKAGIDAGAMAVMTSYNQVNGEWTGQNPYVIKKLLRGDLGYKWLVMTDWWSVYDPAKTIASGQDLEMPGHALESISALKVIGDVYLRSNTKRLLADGKAKEADIDRMATSILRTFIAMGLFERKVLETSYLKNLPQHEQTALQTAREAIVLLRNEGQILPLKSNTGSILLTGTYCENIARGLGSAEVEGFNNVTMADALSNEFGKRLQYVKTPTDDELKAAGTVLISIGTSDSEGWDKPFELSDATNQMIEKATRLNADVVVIVNTGGGVQMTSWYNKVSGIIYGWYTGQNGYTALAEVLSGKTNPSGKLPISIEKKFEDSPGYGYIPAGQKLNHGWNDDMTMTFPINNIEYKEGVFVGYRWYESKKIEPLYPFGFGLSYTTFEYSNLKVSKKEFNRDDTITVEFVVRNTGKVAGAEVAQLYVQDMEASIPRPIKELKGFRKIFLASGEIKTVTLTLKYRDFAFWDIVKNGWNAEAGDFTLMVGSASNDIRLKDVVKLK